MRKGILLLFVFILLLIAPAAVRYLRFYNLNTPSRPLPTDFDPAQVEKVGTPEANAFVDEPEQGDGLVLLDRAHGNQFTLDEVAVLDGRLSQRGFEFVLFEAGDLAAALRPVNAFVVLAPTVNFSADEVLAVVDFVQRGGRLVMVGDPTRYNVLVEDDGFNFIVTLETDQIPLNSLANEFDITFNGDYLYNTVENEGNFRNILLNEAGFADSSLTEGVEKLAFYGAHSLQVGPSGTVLLAGDDQTWSSATDRPGGLSLAAVSSNEQVLALGDIQFMFEPYHTVLDNGRFIAHIADFLIDTNQRQFVLSDFPFFLSSAIDLIYTGAPELGADAFDEIITLQSAFRQVDRELTLAAEAGGDKDTIYVGLYNQADDVSKILDAYNIELIIDPPIEPDEPEAEETSDEEPVPTAEPEPAEDELRVIQSRLGTVQMAGTALIVLHETDEGQHEVVVLAASHDGLENSIDRLLQLIPLDAEAALAGCLQQDNIALCPTNISDEEVEAELISGGTADMPEDDDEEVVEDDDTDDPGESVDIDAVDQGTIVIGDEFEATQAENENHAWTFSSGPATIDIIVEGGDDFDAVLELYDPDNVLLQSADNSFTEGAEELLGVEIADDGDYTIVVRDFFADGGSYTIRVTEGDSEGAGTSSDIETIFIFSDDDGTPLNGGVSSGDILAERLSTNYEVVSWVSTMDGPLNDDLLADSQLVIWDTGDYEDTDDFFEGDTAVILEYLDSGGNIFITGSIPALFNTFERTQISNVQPSGDDPTLLADLPVGESIALDQSYETVLSDLLLDDLDDGTIPFLLNADSTEHAVGIAALSDEINNQNAVILLIPLVALPTDVQPILVDNILNWFESVQTSS